MNKVACPVLALALATGAAFAQASSAPAASASQPKSSQHAKAVCKDGTTYTGRTLEGACRGHGGIVRSAQSSSTSTGNSSSAASTSGSGKPLNR